MFVWSFVSCHDPYIEHELCHWMFSLFVSVAYVWICALEGMMLWVFCFPF